MLIPISDSTKAKLDPVAVVSAGLSFLKVIPWPEFAAFLACIYTGLRIIEWVIDRVRGRKHRD